MTGSYGFVGTNLIETFSGEHEIIRWAAKSDDDFSDCDTVIHLAGKAHDTKNVTQEKEYFKANTELTEKIFNNFLRSKAKKFIFFSSIKAQDNDTPYARSKKAAEDYIMNEIPRQAWNDKKVYILRPCMIHGKGVKGNLPLLFKYVKKGWPWPLGAFENKRSYLSVGNVCYVVNELLKKDIESGIYNLSDDEPISTNELTKLISRSLGLEIKILAIPKGIVRFVARIGDIINLPLNTERLNKLTSDNIVDNSEIKIALGISQMPVKAVDGMKTTIREMIMR